ncbi:MAG: hypothetical protein AAGJ34_13300 [Pseudomonadota bacterium]
MTKTLTLAALATFVSTAAFAMVPSNEAIKKDIMDLGFSVAEVEQIPADQLPLINFTLNQGDDSDARKGARALVASYIYDGGVSAEDFTAWNNNNGHEGGGAATAGVDFTPNAVSGSASPLTGGFGSDAN